MNTVATFDNNTINELNFSTNYYKIYCRLKIYISPFHLNFKSNRKVIETKTVYMEKSYIGGFLEDFIAFNF